MSTEIVIAKIDRPILLGAALPVLLRSSATAPSTPIDFTTTPVTLYFDGPYKYGTPGGVRHRFAWLPGDLASDLHFAMSGSDLTFTLNAYEATAMLYVGKWQCAVCLGPEISQQPIGVAEFTVAAVSPFGPYLAGVTAP